MRTRVISLAVLSCGLLGVLASNPARAEIGASGTRLSVSGAAPRFYMTYGHAQEPELYAPIVDELRRLQVTFQRRGEDYLVYFRGVKIGDWPIVRKREELPETGEDPCVLVLGGQVFVPVRKLEEMKLVRVRVDKATNFVSIAPGTPKVVSGVTAQQPTAPGAPDDGSLIALTGVEVNQNGGVMQIRIRSSAPIRPTMLRLKNPPRLVLDFGDARWQDGVQVPDGGVQVKKLRLGHPIPTTARLALDLDSDLVNLTGLKVTNGEVLATVGQGQQVARANISPDTASQIIKAIQQRNSGRRMGDRSLPPLPIDVTNLRPDVEPPSVDPGTGLRVRPAGSLAGKLIAVDAGHGGHDSGAHGLNHYEKDLCLKMCLELKAALEARGASVLLTRSSDSYVSLDERCRLANSSNANLFISIHCNSTPRRNSASGSQTYWRTPQSMRLARAMHSRLVGAVGGKNGGIRNRSFCVIRETNMPSVLLEIAYINNSQDEQLLASPGFHGNLADSLAQGVLDYYGVDIAE